MGRKKNNKPKSKGKKAGGTNNKGSPEVEEDGQRKPFFLKEDAAKKKNAEAEEYLVKDDVRVRGLSTLSFTSAKSKAQPEESREYSSKIPFCDGIVWSCNVVKSQVREDRFDVELTVYGARFDSAEPMPHPLDPSKQLQRGERIINGEEWKSKPVYVRIWCIEHYEANEECDIKSLNELKEAQTIAKKSSGNEESGSSGDSSVSPNASPASSGQQSLPGDGAQQQVHQDSHAMSQSEEPALSGESNLSPNASPASSEQQSSPYDSAQHQAAHQDSHAMSQSEEPALSGESSLSPNASPASSEQHSSTGDSAQHHVAHQDHRAVERNASNNQVLTEAGVPFAKHVIKVLNLGDDIFLVRQIELVRKAIDSAAQGLHWHVMYTLVHSAAFCLQQGRPEQQIKFKGKSEESGYQEIFRADVGEDAKAWERNDDDSLRNLMSSLYEFRSQIDFRTILKHIRCNNRRSHYYHEQAGTREINQLLDLVNAFYHRNAIMPTDWDKGETAEDIDRRETALTKMIFDDLSGLIKAVKINADTVNKLNSKSLQRICKDIGEVAEFHFKAVERIRRQCLSHVGARDHHQEVARSKEVLDCLEEILLDGTSKPKNPTPEDDFVLLLLWARFGASKDDMEKVKNELKVLRGNHMRQRNSMRSDSTGEWTHAINQRLKPLKLKYPQLVSNKADTNRLPPVDGLGCPKIINWNKEGSVDPFGLTNLDMAFRALDVTGLALRRLLIACAEMQSVHGIEENDYYRFRQQEILKKVSESQDFPVQPMSPIAMTQSGGNKGQVVIFQHQEGSEATLLEEFCARHELEPTQPASILSFVKMDPHWGDTRFLLKFFDSYSRPSPDEVSIHTKMRDTLAHQKHIKGAPTADLQHQNLKPWINEMVQLVDRIRLDMGLDELKDMEELLALQELHQATDHLKRLRDRQKSHDKPECGAGFREKAIASIRRLRTALKSSSGGESDSSSLVSDMSWGILNTGAIKQLLHLYDAQNDNMRNTDMSRTSSAQTAEGESSTDGSTDNIYALLGDDE